MVQLSKAGGPPNTVCVTSGMLIALLCAKSEGLIKFQMKNLDQRVSNFWFP